MDGGRAAAAPPSPHPEQNGRDTGFTACTDQRRIGGSFVCGRGSGTASGGAAAQPCWRRAVRGWAPHTTSTPPITTHRSAPAGWRPAGARQWRGGGCEPCCSVQGRSWGPAGVGRGRSGAQAPIAGFNSPRGPVGGAAGGRRCGSGRDQPAVAGLTAARRVCRTQCALGRASATEQRADALDVGRPGAAMPPAAVVPPRLPAPAAGTAAHIPTPSHPPASCIVLKRSNIIGVQGVAAKRAGGTCASVQTVKPARRHDAPTKSAAAAASVPMGGGSLHRIVCSGRRRMAPAAAGAAVPCQLPGAPFNLKHSTRPGTPGPEPSPPPAKY